MPDPSPAPRRASEGAGAHHWHRTGSRLIMSASNQPARISYPPIVLLSLILNRLITLGDMIVVLYGDTLHVYTTVLSLLETYGPIGLQILVLEDRLYESTMRLSRGPLPWCINSLKDVPFRNFITQSAYRRSDSSVMFLESITKSQSPRVRSLDHVQTSNTLMVKPSPHQSDLLMYHPDSLQSYLRGVLSLQRNVSFAGLQSGASYNEETIRHLLPNHLSNSIIIRIKSQDSSKLKRLNLSRILWAGLRDLRLPDVVKVMEKTQSIVDVRTSRSIKNFYEIQTSATPYDLATALRISGYVGKIVDGVIISCGTLGWSRL